VGEDLSILSIPEADLLQAKHDDLAISTCPTRQGW
jgi:hypothetical protein